MPTVKVSQLAPAGAAKNDDALPVARPEGSFKVTRKELLQASGVEGLDVATAATLLRILHDGRIIIATNTDPPVPIATFDVANRVFVLENNVPLQVKNPTGGVGLSIACDAGGNVTCRNLANSDSGSYYGNAGTGNVNGAVHFQAAGIDRVVITGDGKVGIGTDAPTKACHIVGDTIINGRLHLAGTVAATTPAGIVRKLAVADPATGALLGWLPLYSGIS